MLSLKPDHDDTRSVVIPNDLTSRRQRNGLLSSLYLTSQGAHGHISGLFCDQIRVLLLCHPEACLHVDRAVELPRLLTETIVYKGPWHPHTFQRHKENK